MKNALSNSQLDLFKTSFGAEAAESISNTDPRTLSARVPSSWLDLVADPSNESVRALWASAAQSLPRFVEYLSRSIEGAAVFETNGFPVLVMALPDWDEASMELNPGFFWMGAPTSQSLIDQFVDKAGPIPEPLEHLWRVANFATTKEHSMLCSLDEATRSMTEAPVILPPLPDVPQPEGRCECLQIAVVNNQIVTGLIRDPGERAWKNYLVRRFRRADMISRSIRLTLDDRLADWTFWEWDGENAVRD